MLSWLFCGLIFCSIALIIKQDEASVPLRLKSSLDQAFSNAPDDAVSGGNATPPIIRFEDLYELADTKSESKSDYEGKIFE